MKRVLTVFVLLFLLAGIASGVFLVQKGTEPKRSLAAANIPQGCPAQACPEGYQCLEGNCIQCGKPEDIFPPPEESTLKDYAVKRGLVVGALINYGAGDNETSRALFAKEYGMIIAGIFMNLAQPERDVFKFGRLNSRIKIAEEYNKLVQAVSLIFPKVDEKVPWLKFDQPDCGGWSKDELDAIMKKHIQTLVSHAGEKVLMWEVVNEPFNFDGSLKGCWNSIIGEEYIENSFRYAYAANSKALLMLNESFGQQGVPQTKAAAFFALVQRLKDKGVPIHVVGIQLHLRAHLLKPNYLDEIEDFMKEAQRLGVQVAITEMDVYQGPASFFEEPFLKQKEIFKNVVATCLKYPHCNYFLTWGISDKYSWLRTMQNLPDAKPLLFDDDYQRKPAYYGVMGAIKENTTRTCMIEPTPTPTPTATPSPTPTLTPTPTATPTPTPVPLLGDLDHDGDVDIYDYNQLVADFGKTGAPGFIPADIILNGKVDIYDYNLLVTNFGKSQ